MKTKNTQKESAACIAWQESSAACIAWQESSAACIAWVERKAQRPTVELQLSNLEELTA